MIIASSVAAFCAALYLIGYCHRRTSWTKTIVKTASVLLLAVAAWLGGGPGLLVLALALCAAGDYFLSREGEGAFLAGVGAFAAGHLAYIALFLSLPQSDPGVFDQPQALIGAMVMILFGGVMIRLLFRPAGDLRFAILGYVPVIVLMGLAAVTLPATGALAFVLPSALAFMLSDTILATELFLLPQDHKLRRLTPYAIWVFYWLAQFGFFLGLG